MLKIAICDDEEHSVKALSEIVSQYAQQNNMQIQIETFLSGVALLQAFNRYDFIFLDIDMPGKDGIETAKEIRIADMICKIVYVTSHVKFALQALAVHAFGYITKPFSRDSLFSLLNDYMRSVRTIKKRNIVTFKSANESLCFDADEILFFEYCRNKGVKIVTSNVDRYFHCTLHEAFKKTEVYGFAMPTRASL